jgi:hypothetical protein
MSQHPDDSDQQGDQEGTVSEAGSSALNAETALGGADSVPDTPDVNDSEEGGSTDVNVAHEESDPA